LADNKDPLIELQHKMKMHGTPDYIMMVAHTTFKILSIYFYIYLTWLWVDLKEVYVFSVVLISQCLDFWITKNITGRYLVGLRWWSSTDFSDFNMDQQFGHEFKEYDHIYEKSYNSVLFWWSLYFVVIYWSIMVTIKVLSLSFFWVSFFLQRLDDPLWDWRRVEWV
jgi:hypothetical protein